MEVKETIVWKEYIVHSIQNWIHVRWNSGSARVVAVDILFVCLFVCWWGGVVFVLVYFLSYEERVTDISLFSKLKVHRGKGKEKEGTLELVLCFVLLVCLFIFLSF